MCLYHCCHHLSTGEGVDKYTYIFIKPSLMLGLQHSFVLEKKCGVGHLCVVCKIYTLPPSTFTHARAHKIESPQLGLIVEHSDLILMF